METIKEGKIFLKNNINKGVNCPCCSQRVQLYKRKLNSGMAYTLIAINNHSNDYFHVKDMLREKGLHNGHDWTLLKFWGFIKKEDEIREDGSPNNGNYKITDKGIDFVLGRIKTYKHIMLYNKKCYGFSKETTTITEALGNKFNYNELMGI
jgi:hypothetical protein